MHHVLRRFPVVHADCELWVDGEVGVVVVLLLLLLHVGHRGVVLLHLVLGELW